MTRDAKVVLTTYKIKS